MEGHEDHQLLNNIDTIVVLDLNSLMRLGDLGQAIAELSDVNIVNIDHHPNPQDFASVQCIDTAASSTCAMLAEIIEEQHMTSEAAMCLYTGIMTDTGSFRFPRTTSSLFRTVAKLVDAGADPVESYEQTLNVNTPQRMQLLGLALKGMKLYYDGQLCVMTVRKKDLCHCSCSNGRHRRLCPPHSQHRQGVRMGILLIEADDAVKCSFRSKGNVYIRELAESFGGGGHDYAAGARVFDTPFSLVYDKVVKGARQVLGEANAR